jgi:hypothetical protein
VGEKIQDIDPTKLSITKTTTPKDLLPPEELIFGRNFSGKGSSALACNLVADRANSRSYALARMDGFTRMAGPTHHTVSKP